MSESQHPSPPLRQAGVSIVAVVVLGYCLASYLVELRASVLPVIAASPYLHAKGGSVARVEEIVIHNSTDEIKALYHQTLTNLIQEHLMLFYGNFSVRRTLASRASDPCLIGIKPAGNHDLLMNSAELVEVNGRGQFVFRNEQHAGTNLPYNSGSSTKILEDENKPRFIWLCNQLLRIQVLSSINDERDENWHRGDNS